MSDDRKKKPPAPTVVPLHPVPRRRSSTRPDDALAAGAARARGERARRKGTPLIAASPRSVEAPDDGAPSAVSDDTPLPSAPSDEPTPIRAPRAPRTHRPRPQPRPDVPVAAKAVRKAQARRPPGAVAAVPSLPAELPSRSGLEALVGVLTDLVRGAAKASGIADEDLDETVAQTLAFLRRRLTGDYTVDEFGFDEDFTEHAYLPLLRPVYRHWFRIEVRGIEHIPDEGPALVVANHSGTLALDSLMTQVAVHDEHPRNRHLRMLGADLVFQTPLMGGVARKSGSTLAASSDAERLLGSGELVGVWPEGFKGVGKPFSERYKLQRFGRGGFVSAALRTGAPIVPCSIVGAEEIYPMLGNAKTLARVVGAPYFPLTPTFPWLGPLGLIPLPSRWIIEFGAPVDTSSLGSGAADDPMVVFDLTDQVRETIQQTLYALLMQRRSVFV